MSLYLNYLSIILLSISFIVSQPPTCSESLSCSECVTSCSSNDKNFICQCSFIKGKCSNRINVEKNAFFNYFDGCIAKGNVNINDMSTDEMLYFISFSKLDQLTSPAFDSTGFTNPVSDDPDFFKIEVKVNEGACEQTPEFSYTVEMSDVKEVNIYTNSQAFSYVISVNFYFYFYGKCENGDPFTVKITKTEATSNLSLIIAAVIIAISIILCAITIYCFGKKLKERERLRNERLMQLALQRNQGEYGEIGFGQQGEAGRSEEEIKEENEKKIEYLLRHDLKKQKFEKKMGEKDGKSCTVCLEEYEIGKSDVSVTPCGHVYHFKCLSKWLHNNLLNPKCPNCNNNLLSVLEGKDVNLLLKEEENYGKVNLNMNLTRKNKIQTGESINPNVVVVSSSINSGNSGQTDGVINEENDMNNINVRTVNENNDNSINNFNNINNYNNNLTNIELNSANVLNNNNMDIPEIKEEENNNIKKEELKNEETQRKRSKKKKKKQKNIVEESKEN